MTTALNIIERALTDLTVLEGGGSASAQESADGLIYLNDLIQSWSNEGLTIYANTVDTLTLTGAVSYTMGTGGTFSVARPVSVKSAYCTYSGYDYPVDIISRDQYEAIADKDATSDIPTCVYVNYTYPYATVYVYPVPSSGTLSLSSDKPLTEQATAATVLSMPQGYERALRLNLAVELMPQYGLMNQAIIAMAMKAKADIKRVNAANNQVLTGLGLPTYGGMYRGNILTG
jgi:hypothetical protein